jgi:hypothetical protein
VHRKTQGQTLILAQRLGLNVLKRQGGIALCDLYFVGQVAAQPDLLGRENFAIAWRER